MDRYFQKIAEILFRFLLNTIYQCTPKTNEFTQLSKNTSTKFSIIIPAYESNLVYLIETLTSISGQTYPNWELCLSISGSNFTQVEKLCREVIPKDKIKLTSTKTKLDISTNTNRALELATGDYCLFVDHDDTIEKHSLEIINHYVNANENPILLYTDHDKYDGRRYFDPIFKSIIPRDYIYNLNYINHLTVVQTDIAKKYKFDPKYNGAQDWHFILKIIHSTSSKNITHIPRVLYHWRSHPNSTSQDPQSKSYAYIAQKKVLEKYLPKHKIQVTPYLGTWQIDTNPYPKPYSIYLNSLIQLFRCNLQH